MVNADLLLERMIPVPESGCWLWTGGLSKGYGNIMDGTRCRLAHRVSYELFVGEIPKGKQVLHRCDVPCCINPRHLFLGTRSDNMRDCFQKGRAAAQKITHCAQGHEFSESNTYTLRGHRYCRACRRNRKRAWRH